MDSKKTLAKKKNRRSVLNSARRNLSNVDETNNYQLAEALAKTRVELSKTHSEKFLYVAQNLKFMETITHLKDENKRLSMHLADRENEIQRMKTQLSCHENSVRQLNRSFDDLKACLGGDGILTTPKTISSPSLASSFDSGLNSSSINSSSERSQEDMAVGAPLAAKELFSPDFVPDRDIIQTITPNVDSDKENMETPRIPKPLANSSLPSATKRQKRKFPEDIVKEEISETVESSPLGIMLETPQIKNIKTAISRKRETPSRSAKSAVKSMVEPKLGSKLRQGDPNTDPFFLTS